MRHIRRWFTAVLAAAVAAPVMLAAPAAAEMIGTDRATAQAPAGGERERVGALLARPEVAKQLQSLGIAPGDAQARVNAMTDQEVHALAMKVDQLPAGGNFSDFQWIMIIIGVVIIALLV